MQQSNASGAADGIDGGAWNCAEPRANAALFDFDFAQVHKVVDDMLPLQRLATMDGEAIESDMTPLHRFANARRARAR
jgi:hypothetical protein